MANYYPWLLFHPNIPKPLHELNPRTIKGQAWWNKTKAEAKAKLNQHCWACGVHKSEAKYHKWLEAHECYSMDFSTGAVTYAGTSALCHACHNYIHDGRMRVLCEKNQFHWDKYVAILEHGNAILKRWFLKNGWGWETFKAIDIEYRLYFDVFPELPRFSNKIYWKEDGLSCRWQDYHLIFEGKRYEAKYKDSNQWLTRFND